MPRTHESKRTNIIIVDDHPIVRRGLAHLVNQQEGFAVCAEADTASQALELIKTHEPGLAIVDISLKDSNGLDLVKDISRLYPHLPVLVVSMHEEEFYAERALKAGAKGYVMKQEASETVVEAVRCILRGQIYVSEAMSGRLLRRLAANQASGAEDPVEGLSDRELEVFCLIGRGVKTSEIAERLHLSAKTVETYRARIKAKLHLGSSTELTRFAVEWTLAEGKP